MKDIINVKSTNNFTHKIFAENYFSHFLFLLVAVFIVQSFESNAQAPQKFNYQAVARDAGGNILASHAVLLRLTIHDISATGTVLYSETHFISTNQFGLFTVPVGGGTPGVGVFANINWALNAKFLQVEIDLGGGYSDMGASQLLSVPYALYAASSPAISASSGLNGTQNYLAKFITDTTAGNSQIFDNGSFVGIGTTTAIGTEKLHVENVNGMSVYGYTPSGTSNFGAIQGEYNGTGAGSGVVGFSSDGSGDGIAGIKLDGSGMGTSGMYSGSVEGYGVYGNYNGGGTGSGGRFESSANTALIALSINEIGVRAQQGTGSGQGSTGFPAVFADANTNIAVLGNSASNIGVVGLSFGTAGTAYGVYGESNLGGLASIGTVGISTGGDGTGVYGEVDGTTGICYAVYGVDNTVGGLAGAFQGGVTITGDLNVGGVKNFMIDHPLDPQHKVLYHHCIESPDVLNVYSGNITTDATGKATVSLPDYFEALNKDFKYQLTCIGTFARTIVAEEIRDNKFIIETDAPHIKVSWQVTGTRNDAAMKVHVPVTEREKQGLEIGKYYCPEAYGFGKEMGALKNSGKGIKIADAAKATSHSPLKILEHSAGNPNHSSK